MSVFNNVARSTILNIKNINTITLEEYKRQHVNPIFTTTSIRFPHLTDFILLQIGFRPQFFTPRLYCKLTQFLCSLSFYVRIEISSSLTFIETFNAPIMFPSLSRFLITNVFLLILHATVML